MPKKILLLLLICLAGISRGQNLNSGYSVGLAFSFGTVCNRLGFHAGTFVNYGFAQVNIALNGYYNFKSLALQKKTFELQFGGGMQFGFGYRDSIQNPFIGLNENNTAHKYAAGFSCVQYWDNQGTTQSTGILNLNVENFNFSTENDLFGNLLQQTDRFRTGAFLIEYQYQMTKVGVNALLWTPDYAHCAVIVNDRTQRWARFGYYQDEAVESRNQALGLLSLQVRQWLPYNQEATLNLGVNSEKIRNAIQNEFIHDQPFFPSKVVKRKPAHIPMITIDNQQFLHESDQVVRPAKFYFNLGLNPLPFY